MNDYYFSEEHELFRQGLRSFLAREVLPYIDDWEAAGSIPREIWKKFGDMGYFGLMYPERYGGSDADFFFSVILLEELQQVNSAGFAAAITAHPFLALTHIQAQASEDLKSHYLKKGIAGELFGGLAITEPGTGSDVANISTKAIKKDGHYVINGAKTFITNGVLSDFLVVAVKTDPEAKSGGISMIIVDRDSPGLHATALKKLGWHASDTAELSFDDVRVPESQLLGQENMGFYYIMQHFALERLILAIGSIGAAEAAIAYTLQYMAERQAFGRPINRFQVLRHKIAQLCSEVEMNKQFNYYLSRCFDDGKALVKEAAMAKLLSTKLCDRVMYDCLQCFGGYGYMEEYKMARMFRDSRLGTIGGGTSEIMCEIIAKGVIDGVGYV